MPKRILKNENELSTPELAQYLGCSRHTIIYWLKTGRIDEPKRRGVKRIWSRSEAEGLKRRMV